MNKFIIPLAAAAFLFGGCEKISGGAAADTRLAAAQEAAARAEAKVEARLAALASEKSAAAKASQAGEALVAMLCSSPNLMEDIEGNMDMLKALSGEGGDADEVKRQFLDLQRRYRAAAAKALPAHGVSYAEFSRYAEEMISGRAPAEQQQKFKAIITEKCPRGNGALLEKTAGGLMRFCARPGPDF